jgi:GTP-sensing pleiotropic transcriptional regulator CodY
MYIKLAILQDDSANNHCTSVGIKRSHVAQERILNEIRTRTFTFMVNETLAKDE